MEYLSTPSREDKLRWSKLAQHAYREDHNDIGHFFSGLAAMRDGETMRDGHYMLIQNQTHDWEHFGWWPNLNERIKL